MLKCDNFELRGGCRAKKHKHIWSLQKISLILYSEKMSQMTIVRNRNENRKKNIP